MARKTPESSIVSQFLREDAVETEIAVRPEAKQVHQPLYERVVSNTEPLVFLRTNEGDSRISRHLQKICDALIPERTFYVAGAHIGVYEVSPQDQSRKPLLQSREATMENVLNRLSEIEEPAVIFMPNPNHTYFMDNTRGALPTTAALFSITETLKFKGSTLVMAAPITTSLPPEYHSVVRPLDFPPPDEMERRAIIHRKIEDVRRQIEADTKAGLVDAQPLYVEQGITSQLVDALTGLTEGQIDAVLSRTIGYYGELSTQGEANVFERIDKFRQETAEGSGLLRAIDTSLSHHVAGCDGFFGWLEKRRHAFTPGHPLFPNSIVLLGLTGTGKTLLAERIGAKTGLPTFEAEKRGLAGEGIVGSKARAMAALLAETEAAAGSKGCVVRLDEAEKYFGGQKSSAITEGGATEEAIGIYNTTMQRWANEHKPVCIVLTINRVELMEPEQFRAGGRGNAVVMFNPPTRETREQAAGILMDYWQEQYRKSGFCLSIAEDVTPQFISEVTDISQAEKLGIPPRIFTGGDIRGALENAIVDMGGKETITRESFLQALQSSTSSAGLFPEQAMMLMARSTQIPDVGLGRPLIPQEAEERYRPIIDAASTTASNIGRLARMYQSPEENQRLSPKAAPLSYIRRR